MHKYIAIWGTNKSLHQNMKKVYLECIPDYLSKDKYVDDA